MIKQETVLSLVTTEGHPALFDSITIENGTLKQMCAEGASLPLRGADAEMERPGDHYTFGPIVSGARPRKRRNESTPTHQHTGKGPCERMDRNPRHWTVKEQKRKEEEKEQEGKKHRTKETKNNVPLSNKG